MYPFERFDEDAKRALTLAQEEAERAHHSYIGTEHLLLGLLRLPSGKAHEVLRELGIEIEEVRRTIASVIGRTERILIQQIVPTSRVKMVIEIAFEEARRMGGEMVDSGHLLMALAVEGEGIAAHVLADLGAPAEKVVAAVERRSGLAASGRGMRPQPRLRMPPMVRMRMGESRTIAGFRPAPPPSSDAETLHRLLTTPHIATLLRRRGFDVDRVVKELADPPPAVQKLRGQLVTARSHLADAVGHSDYERAAQVQKNLVGLAQKLKSAEEAWLETLGK